MTIDAGNFHIHFITIQKEINGKVINFPTQDIDVYSTFQDPENADFLNVLSKEICDKPEMGYDIVFKKGNENFKEFYNKFVKCFFENIVWDREMIVYSFEHEDYSVIIIHVLLDKMDKVEKYLQGMKDWYKEKVFDSIVRSK